MLTLQIRKEGLYEASCKDITLSAEKQFLPVSLRNIKEANKLHPHFLGRNYLPDLLVQVQVLEKQ